MLRPQKLLEVGDEVLPAVEAALRDQRKRGPCLLDVRGPCRRGERDEIHAVLRPDPVVPGEDLQRDEVPARRDGNPEARKDFEGIEPRVEHHSSLLRRGETGGGQATGRLLLHDRVEPIAATLEVPNHAFGIVVARDGDDQIDIAGEPRLGPGGDCQGTDERPLAAEVA